MPAGATISPATFPPPAHSALWRSLLAGTPWCLSLLSLLASLLWILAFPLFNVSRWSSARILSVVENAILQGTSKEVFGDEGVRACARALLLCAALPAWWTGGV